MWCSAGKFGGVFAAIPQPIVAAILCITFGMVGEFPLFEQIPIQRILIPSVKPFFLFIANNLICVLRMKLLLVSTLV
jgi:hypothetical protein